MQACIVDQHLRCSQLINDCVSCRFDLAGIRDIACKAPGYSAARLDFSLHRIQLRLGPAQECHMHSLVAKHLGNGLAHAAARSRYNGDASSKLVSVSIGHSFSPLFRLVQSVQIATGFIFFAICASLRENFLISICTIRRASATSERENLMKIGAIDAYQIFDSRGNPTVEAVVTLDTGVQGFGLVPSGASTGQYEALELRDGDSACFRGKSVQHAIDNVRSKIAPVLLGMDVTEQAAIDRAMIELDGTENKSTLGANAILGVSMAVANAAASATEQPLHRYLSAGEGTLLPLPEIQIIGGGAHANWRTDVQDFLLMATGARTYVETLEITHNVYHAAGDIFKERNRYLGLADEGGFWPDFESNEAVFDFFVEAIERAGYTPGVEASISLDIAASDLYRDGRYRFELEDRSFSSDEFVELLAGWCERYPVISIEDPLADTDWGGWAKFYALFGHRIQIIGDDLFTTNLTRIQEGIDRGVANSVLIKLNQIGTVTETLDAIRLTQEAGWLPVVSARSGETEDAFISHLAVATNAGQLKVGSFARSERMVKWNEVIRIERDLGERATFIGGNIFDRIKQ